MKQRLQIILKEIIHRSILALGATALLALATGAHADFVPNPHLNSGTTVARAK